MSRLRAIGVGLAGGIALAAGLTAALDVQGQACCDPWGVPAANAFISAGTGVVSALTAAVATVVNTVEIGALHTFTQGVGQATGEMAKQTASRRVMEEGRIVADNEIYLAGKAADAAEAAIEPAMLDETITNALLVAEGQQAKGSIVRRFDAELIEAMVAGPYANPNTLVDRHLEAYCDYQHVADGRCQKQAIDEMQNADATVATIYGGSSLTYSDEHRDAALAAVRTLVAPDLLRTVASPTRSGQDDALEAQLLADQAALSVAGHVLNAQVADRTRKRDNL